MILKVSRGGSEEIQSNAPSVGHKGENKQNVSAHRYFPKWNALKRPKSRQIFRLWNSKHVKTRLKVPTKVFVEHLVYLSMWWDNVLGQAALHLPWSVKSTTLMGREERSWGQKERRAEGKRRENNWDWRVKERGGFPVCVWKWTWTPPFTPSL